MDQEQPNPAPQNWPPPTSEPVVEKPKRWFEKAKTLGLLGVLVSAVLTAGGPTIPILAYTGPIILVCFILLSIYFYSTSDKERGKLYLVSAVYMIVAPLVLTLAIVFILFAICAVMTGGTFNIN